MRVSKSGNWRWPPDFSRWFAGRRTERGIRRHQASVAARLRAEFAAGPSQPARWTPVKAWTDRTGAYHERTRRVIGGRGADTIESVWPAGQVPPTARVRRPAGHHRSGRSRA